MSDPSKLEMNQKLNPVAHNRQTSSEKLAAGGGLPSHLDCRAAAGGPLTANDEAARDRSGARLKDTET